VLEISLQEAFLHPHDYLLAVLVSLTQPVVYAISAPLGINGVLKKELGYVFLFSDMEDIRNTKGMSVPDGMVYNERTKILLIPECKSGLTDVGDVHLLSQMKSYSSEEFLNHVRKIIPDFSKAEIVILTFPNVAEEIENLLRINKVELSGCLNIVVWTVSTDSKRDILLIKLHSGTHFDKQLDAKMKNCAECRPPMREFLLSPDIPDNRFAAILGRRFLGYIVTGEKNIPLNKVFEDNPDLALSYPRLKRILRDLFTLIRDLGTYDKGMDMILLKKRIDYPKVQQQLAKLAKMNATEYRQALGMPIEEEWVKPSAYEEMKPTEQQKLNGYI
jgi:hypothetical protein